MIPAALAGQLQRGLADFLRFSFESSTPGMESIVDDFLERSGSVIKGPYVSLKLPFVSGRQPNFFPNVPLPFTPHAHQERAFERLGGAKKQNTLVATGTGSGKTESFLLPILDHCLADAKKGGIKAILIYPMNALATDQAKRIAELIHGNDKLRGKIRAGLYIGESQKGKGGTVSEMGASEVITNREGLKSNPPDILLTNYKMLDYLLLRPADQKIWAGNERGSLRYLVVDELHTFDGAQGTDLACLIRRLKRRLEVDEGGLCCVGTSATLGGEGAASELRAYAGQVFGEEFDEASVITEQRQVVADFLGDVQVEYTDEPGFVELGALDPAEADDPEAWVRAQAGLWFGDSGEDPGTDAWAVGLGERLLAHAAFRSLLDAVGGGTRSFDDLAKAMARSRTPWRAHPRLGRACVASLLGLVSAARGWRAELPEVQKKREAAGKPRPVGSFLDVRLQLWQREMRRMVASVGEKPRLEFSDDLDREQRRRHLPAIHCRDCGAMGWATRVDRDESHVLRADLNAFYRAFFGSDPRVAFLFPSAAVPRNDPEWEKAQRYRVDTKRLVVLGPDEEPDGEEFDLVAPPNTRSLPDRRELHRDCPFCESRESLALVGFRAATLTSVYVDQLFASRFNEDKKLLTFSDSVQDASHRAGFFGARTWRTNLRIAMMRVLVDRDGLTLAELEKAVGESWRKELGQAGWLATFIAPNMLWLHDWDTLQKTGVLPEGSDLEDLVAKRLAFEVVTEFGLQANIGRSLPRTRAAAATLDAEKLEAAVAKLLEPMQNELPGMRDVSADKVRRFLVGCLHSLRRRGGVAHAELPARYVETGGRDNYVYKLMPHMPAYGKSARMPALLADRTSTARFDSFEGPLATNWYARWVDRCFYEGEALIADASSTYNLVLPLMVSLGVLVETKGNRGERFWGLSDQAVRVTRDVAEARCHTCRHRLTIGKMEAEAWQELPCTTARCHGRYEVDLSPHGDEYFARLYAQGHLQRIFTAEHTGLLDRTDREEVEIAFKAPERPEGMPVAKDGDDEESVRWRRPWDPNLLSCTPTLEMGIDIGDLSSTFLCSVPPAQANYLQRIGRAGRRDGNSLVLTVANARPHDQYFYALPEEMMSGDVMPPGVFLDAAAVLERQLTAYCFDRWVATATEAQPAELPAMLKDVFPNLGAEGSKKFPYNLLSFVAREQDVLIRDFHALFAGAIGDASRRHLEQFLRGGDESSGLRIRILRLLEREQKQRDSLAATAKKNRAEMKRLKNAEAKPVDWEDQYNDLDAETEAYMALVKTIDLRRTLEYLTDEGLLPNYAFPESAVRLSSVVWRKRKKVEDGGKKYETWTYEFTRSPASAISELAPHADFYAGGRRVQIDQIDVATSTVENWRFCDACSHAQVVDTGDQLQACPACGSDSWRDEGQKLRMLRLQQVFANSPDRESRIRDDRDDRRPTFFQREILVDVRTEDRGGAWELDGDKRVPFGFEYLKRASFREVNFGEFRDQGQKTIIAGRPAIRPGFEVCLRCGKVQRPNRDPEHTLACPSRKAGAKQELETCLYLYREFSSEALRILLPMADIGVKRRLNSFIAALQVGLRARFGGSVDHLRTTVYSDPVADSTLRRQYLVLYDTVPGGTGYIKQLVTPTKEGGPLPLFEALELARQRIQGCVCWNDAERDGCYRCLYAYRSSRDMDDTSAHVAVDLLAQILRDADKVKPIESIGDISISGLMDSVLEARFIEALRHAGRGGRTTRVRDKLFKGKACYRMTLGDAEWIIEPQVEVPASEAGVNVSIDFVMHPGSATSKRRPIAVLLDGWEYHQDRIGLDLAQRMALMAQGHYDVWSFTWHDLDAALLNEQPLKPLNLAFPNIEKARQMLQGYQQTAHKYIVDDPMIDVFFRLLQFDADPEWAQIGAAICASRMGAAYSTHRDEWLDVVAELVPSWDRKAWRDFKVDAAVEDEEPVSEFVRFHAILDGKRVAGVAYLDDSVENRAHPDFKKAWNGFLNLYTLLRAVPDFWFVTATGLAEHEQAYKAVWQKRQPVDEGRTWVAFEDIEAEFREVAEALMTGGVQEPEIGMEIPDARGDAWAEAELLWESTKIALTSRERLEDAGDRKPAKGWQVFELEKLAGDVGPLVAALKKAKAG